MYNLLMTAYKKKRLWQSVLQVMRFPGPVLPRGRTLVVDPGGVCVQRAIHSVLQVIQQMQANGQSPDAVSFNILIDACGTGPHTWCTPTPCTLHSAPC